MKAINACIFSLFVSTNILFGCQEEPVEYQEAGESERIKELPDELKSLYLTFLRYLRERDIQKCTGLFGEFNVHKSAYSNSRSESALEKSFELAQSDYLNDCRRMMDQLPKTGRLLGILNYDLSGSKVVRIDKTVIVTGIVFDCTYGTGIARLTFSPPPAALVAGKWHFIDRCQQGVRFQSLDPETGE
jgi:hypothetical protein